ncbi:hypothetical protein C5B85_10780 [Pseudoclavibacter sp. AY1F1]|nr:hypothetical protein C5B85_10780 [Pseudoclavibacter sp. AY1F1]
MQPVKPTRTPEKRKPRPKPALLSIPELAVVLNMSRQRAMDMALSGELEAKGIGTRLVGTRVKAIRVDVESYLGHPIQFEKIG